MTRLPSAERRELLIHSAMRVIAAHGVAGATTRAIVAEAGMSLASFHYAFRSHEEMMRELVTHVVEAESLAAFAAITPRSDIHEFVRDALRAFLDYIVAHPEHERVMQELLQYSLRTPGLESLAREQYRRYFDAVESLVVQAAATSDIEWTAPTSDIARLVVAATDGATLAYLADRDAAAAARTLDHCARSIAALAAQPVGSGRR